MEQQETKKVNTDKNQPTITDTPCQISKKKEPDKEFILSPNHRYTTQALMDKGAQGCIYRALDRVTLESCAIKVYSLRPTKRTYKEATDNFEKECTTLKKLREIPGVIMLKDCWRTFDRGYLVLELCSGSLDVPTHGICSLADVKSIAQFLISTVKEIHLKGIRHSDIKPANILRINDSKTPFRLCDFGLARRSDSEYCDKKPGTLDYRSPEGLETSLSPVSYKADIWSIGISLYELYTGKLPFYHESFVKTYDKIRYDTPDLDCIDHVDLQNFIEQCLIKDQYKRPEIKILEQHPFILN